MMTSSKSRKTKKDRGFYNTIKNIFPIAGVSTTVLAAIYASAIIMIIAAIIAAIAAFIKIIESRHK